jgi:hypothetical protein
MTCLRGIGAAQGKWDITNQTAFGGGIAGWPVNAGICLHGRKLTRCLLILKTGNDAHHQASLFLYRQPDRSTNFLALTSSVG